MYHRRSKYNPRSAEPKEINARFKSICPETGRTINPGELCLYYPREKKAYHMESKTAYDYRNNRYDEEILNPTHNWYLTR